MGVCKLKILGLLSPNFRLSAGILGCQPGVEDLGEYRGRGIQVATDRCDAQAPCAQPQYERLTDAAACARHERDIVETHGGFGRGHSVGEGFGRKRWILSEGVCPCSRRD